MSNEYTVENKSDLTKAETITESVKLCESEIEYYGSQLNFADETKRGIIEMGGKLLFILRNLNQKINIVQPKQLNVLSLGCGICIEYLALKCFYGKDVSINYVGIDIDEMTNTTCRNAFKLFPEVIILKGDASDKIAVFQSLKENKMSLEGFSFIFLRHPNILHLSKIFSPMIEEVIPFAATKDACVFVSTYHREEFDAVVEKMKKIKNSDERTIYAVSSGGALDVSFGEREFVVNNRDMIFTPEAFTMVSPCYGSAFKFDNTKNEALYKINRITKALFPYENSKSAWKYAETKNTLWLAGTNKGLLEKIKQYLDNAAIAESIRINQIKDKAEFCIQIILPNLEKLMDVKPMPMPSVMADLGVWSAHTSMSSDTAVVENKQESHQSTYQPK